MLKTLYITLLATLLLSGCVSTSQPIHNVQQEPITQQLTAQQVEKAILLAGMAKTWKMRVVEPGRIQGDIEVRQHQASIEIRYTEHDFSIQYLSSRDLNADENGNIHRNYNRWIAQLDNSIRLELERATPGK